MGEFYLRLRALEAGAGLEVGRGTALFRNARINKNSYNSSNGSGGNGVGGIVDIIEEVRVRGEVLNLILGMTLHHI